MSCCIYLYYGVKLDYTYFNELKDKVGNDNEDNENNKTDEKEENDRYEVTDYVSKLNETANDCGLSVFETCDDKFQSIIGVGYRVCGGDFEKYSWDSLETDLPKFKTFEEFKSDLNCLRNNVDVDKVNQDKYKLIVTYYN